MKTKTAIIHRFRRFSQILGPGKSAFLCVICGSFLFSSCSNMTPEQQAQWSATANAAAQQASGILLDEGAARLKASRKTATADPKD